MSRHTTAEAPDDVDDSALTILELFGPIKSKDENDRLDGLAELSDLVDSAYGDDGAALGDECRLPANREAQRGRPNGQRLVVRLDGHPIGNPIGIPIGIPIGTSTAAATAARATIRATPSGTTAALPVARACNGAHIGAH
jgi:hypothetical protein